MCADMVGPCMSVSNISSSTPHRSVARCPTEVASRLSPALLRSVGVSSRAVYANAGRPRVRTAASAAANGLSDRSEPGEFKDISGEHPPIETIPEPPPAQGIGERIKRFFLGDKLDKSRLAALGLGAVASYGFISNVTYGGGMAVAWIAFVKQMGRSPLMPGQWKAFLAFYAGFWTIQNFVRPLRFSLSVFLAPVFDNFITAVQERTGWSRRSAFGFYLFLLGTSTFALVFGSIAIFAGPLAFARTM